MTHRNPSRLFLALVLWASFCCVLSGGYSWAGVYNPCTVPPVVGTATRPNVMIVMDFSGSMQFPAYFDESFTGYYGNTIAQCYSSTLFKTYTPSYSYYGTFESDKYYVYNSSLPGNPTTEYFELASPQPVNQYPFTAESADGGGGTSIWFTAAGHNFQVGDLVALYDLTSHLSLNSNAYTVAEVSGDRFRIAQKWNGKADKAAGYAIKRIYGSLAPNEAGVVPGVSGNVLNYAVTSRTDAALKALIGGRAICPECTYKADGTLDDGNHDFFLRPQGSRRRVQDNTELQTDIYVRPATLESSATYPDDYDSAGTYYKDSNGHDRDIFVSIKGKYSGQLTAADATYFNKYFEGWTFTLTKRTRVEMSLDGSWPGNDYLSIYSKALKQNGNDNSSQIIQSQANPATISTELDAGTYWVRATYSDDGLGAAYQKPYVIYSNVNLTPYKIPGFEAAADGKAETKIGAIPWARARLRLAKEGTVGDTRKAVIQRSWGQVRFGFMFFKGEAKAYEGKILIGCENDNLGKLINAFEGVDRYTSDTLDFTKVYPYSGTPTGEAMWEAYDYFNQQNNSDNADNSSFIAPGTVKDPLYGSDASGTPRPVPCRKSFVLLLSDGVWNGGVDPVKGAHQLHVTDLRGGTDFNGEQTVETYAILAFSQDQQGYNSMKAVAMYGGFSDVTGCGTANFPFPKSGYPGDSKDTVWPVSECNPNGTYDETCCKEWDKIWDREEDGTNEDKGVPDNYFQASDGKKLEEALLAVMKAVMSRTAAASAVATVSQETRTADVIVRGVFEAQDPDPNVVDTFLWKGHLEAYFPFDVNGKTTYDFDWKLLPANEGKLCMEITGARHCWDAGDILKNEIPGVNRDFIYTWLPDASGKKVQTLFTKSIDRTVFGVATDADRDALVDWVKGVSPNPANTRDRKGWKLGDIVYSTPVIVGPPRLGNVSKRDPNIKEFMAHREEWMTRSKVVYVGANDGMLHAFLMGKTTDGETWVQSHTDDSAIGKELWAYIPSNLLSTLKVLESETYGNTGCKHRAMVDLSARAFEVFIKSDRCDPSVNNGRCWRTVLVGGERGGGDVYFGIDVTDPIPSTDPTKGPKVLWEYSVLQNRVVVELASITDTSCFNACRTTCNAACQAAYDSCYSSCCSTLYGASGCNTSRRRNTCKNQCSPAQTTCQNNCETSCNASCSSPDYRAYVPFRDAYDSIKNLPMTWSQPYIGRLKIPETVGFYVGDPSPASGGDPSTLVTFPASGSDPYNNMREVVFMGGGIHVYDKNFDTTPAVDPRFKLALYWPFLLMMDIETGQNLFEYVWPIILNYNSANFPVRTAGTNTIPYAMSDVLALDVWDQENSMLGDDGFIDRVYVGDMNGYFYGLKFNLDETYPTATSTNSLFGVRVDVWPTKPIDNTEVGTDDYRSALQPITVGPAASFESDSSTFGLPPSVTVDLLRPALRVIFGTGKYDDVVGGDDDKNDTAKMALYNLKDPVIEYYNNDSSIPIGLPQLTATNSREVYDNSHKTNFRVQINPKCGAPDRIVNFSTTKTDGCDWMHSDKTPDCCQSSCDAPCYACIYDLRHPCTGTSNGCLFPSIDPTDKPGERIIGKPVIQGGWVFITTFIPPAGQCEFVGQSHIYAFDYMCRPRKHGPFGEGNEIHVPPVPGGESSGYVYGETLSGMASRGVIDFRGENFIVQLNTGEIIRTPIDLGADKPVQFKGWRER